MRSTFRNDNEPSKGRLLIRHRIKRLCDTCNSEFGARIVEDAKPAVHKALSRDFRGLNWQELDRLSKWAAMFAMTGEFIDPPTKAISQRTREEFRATGNIPTNVTVWIGRYGGSAFQLAQQHLNTSSVFGVGPKTEPEPGLKAWLQWTEQITTFGLGSIFLAVYSYEDFGWAIANMPKPSPHEPSAAFGRKRVMKISPPKSVFQARRFVAHSDESLQDFALEFMPAESRDRVRRKVHEPEISPDFWRDWTDEPDWK